MIYAVAHILVVDSCEEIRVLFADLIAEQLKGHIVDTAKNGEEALVLFQEREYDLVISGVMMCPMNGVELTARIKKLSPNTPVILMSGLCKPKNHQADAFIQKPFKSDAIKNILRKFLL